MQKPAGEIPARRGQRHEYLDLLRCLSITGVVVMHSASPLLHDPAGMWAGLFYTSFSLFCVPALLMISGALMLDGARSMDLRDFYTRRFMKIALPLLAWSAIYYLATCVQVGGLPHLGSFLKRFFTGLWAGPLWFLYMIAGIYLMVPFMRQAFSGRGWERRAAWFAGIVLGLHALNFACRLLWEQELNRFLSGAVIPYYFAYFVLGRLLASVDVRVPGGRWLPAVTFTACGALTAAGEYAAFQANTMLPNTFFSYQQPLAALMAVSAFLLLKGWKPSTERTAGLVREVSCLSYGVFLAHVLVMMLLTGQMPLFFGFGEGLDWNTGGPWAGPLLLGGATFALSAWLTAGLRRLPVLGRIVP